VAENSHLDVKRTVNITFHELCEKYWELHGVTRKMKGLKNSSKFGRKELETFPERAGSAKN
jgi:hypothetical protein